VNTDGLSALPEDCVGEIWLKSASCARGYWGAEETPGEGFRGTLSEDAGEGSILGGGEGGYLRTVDLGFLHLGELFVCGRLKDLIIVRGRNHYPQDIERTCETLDHAFQTGQLPLGSEKRTA
jgi:acyl-CoA synthetase (AMP-forming)/AMP-acid ligase II